MTDLPETGTLLSGANEDLQIVRRIRARLAASDRVSADVLALAAIVERGTATVRRLALARAQQDQMIETLRARLVALEHAAEVERRR